jgi:hypothetical protein
MVFAACAATKSGQEFDSGDVINSEQRSTSVFRTGKSYKGDRAGNS